MNSNEAYTKNHGYLKCPHCDLYIYQIISDALSQHNKELREKIEKLAWEESHLCRFNDRPQKCECMERTIAVILALLNEKDNE